MDCAKAVIFKEKQLELEVVSGAMLAVFSARILRMLAFLSGKSQPTL